MDDQLLQLTRETLIILLTRMRDGELGQQFDFDKGGTVLELRNAVEALRKLRNDLVSTQPIPQKQFGKPLTLASIAHEFEDV